MRAEIDYEMSLLTETTHSSWFVSDFRNANDCYKAGEFNEALERYEKILNSCPTHLGARNNYILTLVHLEQFEEALHNSMLLELMNPGYEGNQVNMLIPLYALGFNEEDLRHAWSDAGLPALGGISDDSILRAYLYNRIYANMEKDMDESAVETNLAAMEDELTYLLEADPTDTDIIELLDYLEGLKKIRKNNEPR